MEVLLFLIFVVWPIVWFFRKTKDDDKITLPKAARPRQRNTTPRSPRPSLRQSSTCPLPSKPPVPSGINRTTSSHTLTGAAYIVDGDSLRIQKTEIRLYGVDAPELNHPFGKKAKWELVHLCKGQTIRADVMQTDVHGRSVARCFLPDGRDLSEEMVKAGLAIDWPKFSGGRYKAFEAPDARKKMWLADARQKGRMHIWEKFATKQSAASKRD